MQQKQTKNWEFMYGMCGGIWGTIVSHPFDTLRIRIQTRNTQNMFRSLYSGISPPLFGIGLEKTVVFGIYQHLLQNTQNMMLSGYLAGICSVFFVTPLEKLKIFLQTGSNLNQLKPRQMFNGFGATLFREPPGYLMYFNLYYNLKPKFDDYIGEQYNLMWNGFVIGMIGGVSGCISWIPIYPADMIKTNRQLYNLSYRQVHQKIIGLEKNYMNYYKGFYTALMRAFPLHGGVFVGYEFSKYIHQQYFMKNVF